MDPIENTIPSQTSIHTYPSNPPKGKKSKKGLLILLVLIVLAATGFWFMRANSGSQESDDSSLEPTQSLQDINVSEDTTPTPEPTKAEEKEASALKLQVLNGSGEEGVATEMKTALEDAGYESIETGNAENFDFEGVTVRAKADAEDEAASIQDELKSKYTFNEDIEVLSDDSLFDIVVIVGK